MLRLVAHFIVFSVFSALSLFATIGCIKVDTSQTTEEATASSESRGSRLRTDWAKQMQNATPVQKVQLVQNYFVSTTAAYVEYGKNIVDQWLEGNAGRGTEIPDSEMRDIVDRSIAAQQPLLDAQEDNFNFGIEQIRLTGHFGRDMDDLLDRMLRHWDQVVSAVFVPSGVVEDYEGTIYDLSAKTERISDELHQLVRNY